MRSGQPWKSTLRRPTSSTAATRTHSSATSTFSRKAGRLTSSPTTRTRRQRRTYHPSPGLERTGRTGKSERIFSKTFSRCWVGRTDYLISATTALRTFLLSFSWTKKTTLRSCRAGGLSANLGFSNVDSRSFRLPPALPQPSIMASKSLGLTMRMPSNSPNTSKSASPVTR